MTSKTVNAKTLDIKALDIKEPAGTFTGRHMAAILLLFFGVIFTANFTMAYFAFSSWTGLVVKNSYVASQKFNETTAKLEKSALAVNTTTDYQNGILTVTFIADSTHNVVPTNVAVMLGRPSREGEDRKIALEPKGDGIFTAMHVLAKGQWGGNITADIAGFEDWQRPVYLVVKE